MLLRQNGEQKDFLSQKKDREQMIPAHFKPNHYTVRCGRGNDCFNSVGNRRLRILVEIHLERYSLAIAKSEKSRIVSKVFDTVHDAGGSFVKQDRGTWYKVGDAAAREKVGAMFRDRLHMQYRSSTKCKTARRRAKRLQKCLKDDDCTLSTVSSFSSGSENASLACPLQDIHASLVEPMLSDVHECFLRKSSRSFS